MLGRVDGHGLGREIPGDLRQPAAGMARHAAAGRRIGPPPRRFEVLNFAVAAYSPLQRLETLRRKVLAFQPDLVIYSATTLDIRLMEIHLCDMLRKRVDLQVRLRPQGDRRTRRRSSAKDLRLDRDGKLIDKERLKEKLRPYYWWLYDRTLGAIAAECRSAGVPLAMVIIPRVGSGGRPRASGPSRWRG